MRIRKLDSYNLIYPIRSRLLGFIVASSRLSFLVPLITAKSHRRDRTQGILLNQKMFNTIMQNGEGNEIRDGKLFREPINADGSKIIGREVAAVARWR